MVDALRSDENCTHLDAEQAQRLADEQSARPRSVDSTPSRRWYVAQTHVHAEIESKLSSQPSGVPSLFAALHQTATPCTPGRHCGGPPISSLFVCLGRHGDATLAFDSIDDRNNKTSRQR